MATIVPACSGDDEGPMQAPTLELSGVYRPVDRGAIGAITFSGSKD